MYTDFHIAHFLTTEADPDRRDLEHEGWIVFKPDTEISWLYTLAEDLDGGRLDHLQLHVEALVRSRTHSPMAWRLEAGELSTAVDYEAEELARGTGPNRYPPLIRDATGRIVDVG